MDTTQTTIDALAAAYTKTAQASPWLQVHPNGRLTSHGWVDYAVSYTPTPDSGTYTVAPHQWLPEYVVLTGQGEVLHRTKTAAAALRALVRLADRAATAA